MNFSYISVRKNAVATPVSQRPYTRPTMPLSPTTTPSHDPTTWTPAAQASIKRQNEEIKTLCVTMEATEAKRLTRLTHARDRKEKKSLSKRFAKERKNDQERLSRLISDTNRIKALAANGVYGGTVLDKSRKPPPIEAEEITGLQARGGLSDNQYKFMKQMFNKFEEPPKRKNNGNNLKPRTPNISFYRDAKISRENERVNSARRDLLQQKKTLLTKLSNVCDQQQALIAHNSWGSSRSTFSNPPMSARSTRSTHTTASSTYSMASMARRPEHTFTRRPTRPEVVPVLF